MQPHGCVRMQQLDLALERLSGALQWACGSVHGPWPHSLCHPLSTPPAPGVWEATRGTSGPRAPVLRAKVWAHA
jgi:hypothetical protein